MRYFRQDIERGGKEGEGEGRGGGGRGGWQGFSWGASGGKEGQREFSLELGDKVFSGYGLREKPTERAEAEK